MLFLAIESSCDETAAAVFDDQLRIYSSVVAAQLREHARFRGVVPELAARAHLNQLLPVIDTALNQAGLRLTDLGAIAVMNTPGLVGALLVGVAAAKMLALTLELPLLAVNHIEAHLFACRLAAAREIYPCVGLVVSGGHTTLFHCHSAVDLEPLGGTIDDAAGEAFDKVAALLELGFPGGPAVARLAGSGDPQAYALPRAFLHDRRLDFSFSGLKTAVRYLLRDLAAQPGGLTAQRQADVAASFQQAVVDVLVGKCRQALAATGLQTLAVGGGVSANQALRAALAELSRQDGIEVVVPPPELCTDNAAMAALAVEHWRAGRLATLEVDAEPRFERRGSAARKAAKP